MVWLCTQLQGEKGDHYKLAGNPAEQVMSHWLQFLDVVAAH